MGENKKFDISKIENKVPISYRRMSYDHFQFGRTLKNRVATFRSYNGGKSKCFFFYKPISRMNYEQEENI